MFTPSNETHFSLTLEGADIDFQVLSFTGHEAVSQPYSFKVELVSERPAVDLESLLHKQAFLAYDLEGNGIHALVYQVGQGDSGSACTATEWWCRTWRTWRTALTSAYSSN